MVTYYPLNRKKDNIKQKGGPRGGIGIFIKNDLKEHVKIRYDLSCENFIWCKMSKKYFGFHDDLYIGVVYFPPESSTREKKINKDHFSQLKNTTQTLNSEQVILMGDFNARTKDLEDVLVGEKDEGDLDEVDFFSTIDTHRANQDQFINYHGRQLAEYCIATRSYIANGRTIGDLRGKYTCHQSRGSSTVDYAIINERLKNHVQNFQVLDPNTGSDHSAIKLKLSLPTKLKTKNDSLKKHTPKIQWNEQIKSIFENKMNSPQIHNRINDLTETLESETHNTEETITELIKLITPDNKRKNLRKPPKKTTPKKWYDHTCHEMS